MSKQDIQDQRISAVLGNEDLDAEEGVRRFFEHLKKNLRLPSEVTGIEDFRWEEFYVIRPGDKAKYERLKKTQPSYRDRYDFLGIELENESEWMLFAGEDIAALVRRKSDNKTFCLGLAELEAIDKKSENCQLLDDYAVWFVNNR